jgi:hypothetical protein
MAPRSVFDCFEATKRPTQTSHPAKTSIERAAKPPRCPMDRRNFSAANKVILFVVKGSFFFPSFSHLFRSSPIWLGEPWVTPFHSLVKHHDCYMKWQWISWIGGQPSIFTPVWNEFGGDREVDGWLAYYTRRNIMGFDHAYRVNTKSAIRIIIKAMSKFTHGTMGSHFFHCNIIV